MRKVHLFGVGLLLLALAAAAGCGNPQGGPPRGDKAAPKEDEHDHGEGPHGGTVADWGGGKYHVEFCVDHGKKQATVYLLDGNAKKAAPVKADKLLLSIAAPPFQVELKALPQEGDPKGASSRFTGTHDNFGKEQEFAGTISGEVEGKPYAGDFKEQPPEGGKARR